MGGFPVPPPRPRPPLPDPQSVLCLIDIFYSCVFIYLSSLPDNQVFSARSYVFAGSFLPGRVQGNGVPLVNGYSMPVCVNVPRTAGAVA